MWVTTLSTPGRPCAGAGKRGDSSGFTGQKKGWEIAGLLAGASERCPAAPTAAVGGSLRGAQRLWLPKGSSISWRLELEGAEAECRYRTPADC